MDKTNGHADDQRRADVLLDDQPVEFQQPDRRVAEDGKAAVERRTGLARGE